MSIPAVMIGMLPLTHEKVIRVRIWATNSEELHQIMKLTMDVAADCNWTFLEDLVSKRAPAEGLGTHHWLHI